MRRDLESSSASVTAINSTCAVRAINIRAMEKKLKGIFFLKFLFFGLFYFRICCESFSQEFRTRQGNRKTTVREAPPMMGLTESALRGLAIYY